MHARSAVRNPVARVTQREAQGRAPQRPLKLLFIQLVIVYVAASCCYDDRDGASNT